MATELDSSVVERRDSGARHPVLSVHQWLLRSSWGGLPRSESLRERRTTLTARLVRALTSVDEELKTGDAASMLAGFTSRTTAACSAHRDRGRLGRASDSKPG